MCRRPVLIDPGVPTRPRGTSQPNAPHPPIPVSQAACGPSNFVCTWVPKPGHTRPVCAHPNNTHVCTQLVTSLCSALPQILGPLDHDDQCGKQKLAYKLEQVITLMSLDS